MTPRHFPYAIRHIPLVPQTPRWSPWGAVAIGCCLLSAVAMIIMLTAVASLIIRMVRT